MLLSTGNKTDPWGTPNVISEKSTVRIIDFSSLLSTRKITLWYSLLYIWYTSSLAVAAWKRSCRSEELNPSELLMHEILVSLTLSNNSSGAAVKINGPELAASLKCLVYF